MKSYAESWESFLEAGCIFLRDTTGRLREYRVTSVRPHKRGLLVELDGIGSVDEAEVFRNCTILASKNSFKKRAEDEYFWFELIGLDVYCEDGLFVGRLDRIIPTPANDVYVVKRHKQEFLIPATTEVVLKVDLQEGKMVIAPLDGMLEIDEN